MGLVTAPYRVGVSTRSTLKGAKYFNSTPNITACTIVIEGSSIGRETDVLPSDFDVNG